MNSYSFKRRIISIFKNYTISNYRECRENTRYSWVEFNYQKRNDLNGSSMQLECLNILSKLLRTHDINISGWSDTVGCNKCRNTDDSIGYVLAKRVTF